MKYYKCSHCGDIVEKVTNQNTDVFCCGKVMEELIPNSVEASKEKHIPVAKYDGGRLFVQVGDVIHPMLPEHHIVFISLEFDDEVMRKNISNKEEPKAVFELGDYHGNITIYEYCNIHGLWKNEVNI